jgi:hypothetical protein
VVAGVREPKFFALNLSIFFVYQGQFSIRHIKRWRLPVFLIKKKAFYTIILALSLGVIMKLLLLAIKNSAA